MALFQIIGSKPVELAILLKIIFGVLADITIKFFIYCFLLLRGEFGEGLT